ncbi:MAG: hypothetical protein GF364_19920, partial [Candidatus Lokiarchaeota archaeon]|nr:hypothetical protein [Candidatus Lokiarchaeota archaeon]
MKMGKRNFKILVSCSIICFVFLSIYFSIDLSAADSDMSIQDPESSSLDFSNIYISEGVRNVYLGEMGLTRINDVVTIYNNGSEPLDYFYYTIENAYLSNMKYIGCKTDKRSSLVVQDSINKINGLEAYIIYLDDPLLPKSTKKVTITTVYIDIIITSGSRTTQLCDFEIGMIPTIPYKILSLDVKINIPSGATVGTFNPEGTAQGTTQIIYDFSDLSSFTSETLTGQYTYNTNPILEYLSIIRKVDVNTWDDINIQEEYVINNTGNIPVTTLKWQVPIDAENVTARDDIGTITGVTLVDQPNADGNTRNVTLDLTSNRSPMNGKSALNFIVEYHLPLENYYSWALKGAILKLNLMMFKTKALIRYQETNVFLYAGDKIKVVTLTPDEISYQSNSLVLTYEDHDLVGLEAKYLYLEYKRDAFQFYYRPVIFIFLILTLLSSYVALRRKMGRSTEFIEIREDIVPESEIREFVTLYEEINAIRIDLQKLREQVARKKIHKKEYQKSRRMLLSKLKNAQDEITSFKKYLIDAGGRFSEIVKKLDLHEAELLANQDGIKLHEERYRKGKLPSKRAYNKLKDQMIKQ